MDTLVNSQQNNTQRQDKYVINIAKKQIKLLLNSEFQPIHNGHLRMMEAAKKLISERNEAQNIECEIQGLLIPLNKQQLFFQYLEDDVRLRMISLAIKDSSWLNIDESFVSKKFKSMKEFSINLTNKFPTLEVYEVISVDKFFQVNKQINDYTSRNVIFVEERFSFDEYQLEEIKTKIRESTNLQFISDCNHDVDISSRVIRDIYIGGYDISLYVTTDIAKFHKSQNIKYKLNPSSNIKIPSKKNSKINQKDTINQNEFKKDKNLSKNNTKESKKDGQESKKYIKESRYDEKQNQSGQQQKKHITINLKSFIEFDFNLISYKSLSGFNINEDKKPVLTEDNENKRDNQVEVNLNEEQKTNEKDENFLGSGLQAKVFSMIYKFIDIDVPQQIPVAVKMVKFNNQVSRKQATFYRELRALSKCNGHRNVVACYGAGNIKDVGYMVLERCAKKRFKYFIQDFKPEQLYLSKHFMQLLTDLCDGCYHMAKQGILHRDLQINNILMKLDQDDQNLEVFQIEDILELKISDFGVSAINEDKENIVKGSTRHYSPEAIQDKANYTDKSDVYSFGALLYEIFYKHWVFSDCTVQESCDKTKQGLFTPLGNTIPLQIQEIILNTWKFNPIERISFAELKQKLQEYTIAIKI